MTAPPGPDAGGGIAAAPFATPADDDAASDDDAPAAGARVKVYTRAEIAEWERQNTRPPPAISARQAAFWNHLRAERLRLAKAAATRAATREHKKG